MVSTKAQKLRPFTVLALTYDHLAVSGGWDAGSVARTLGVPPPAARALAASLQATERLPLEFGMPDLVKRCGILQQELGLTAEQVRG